MDAIPIVFFWVLALWGLAGRTEVLVYLFFGSMPFGAFAVVPPELLGGLTLTPTTMVAILIILRSVVERDALHFFSSAALAPRGLLLLSLFWLVALITTYFAPRMFVDTVMVIPMRTVGVSAATPLAPTTQNFSQLMYMSVSVFTVFAFAWQLRLPRMRQHAMNAICLGAALTVGTGLLDQLNLYLPLDPLLAPFRTATYALLTDVEMFGGKRVVGLMPEASAYGATCCIFLAVIYFFRPAISAAWLRERGAPTLIALLIVFIWLSTSSGAYVCLAVFALLAALYWVKQRSGRSSTPLGGGPGFEFWTAYVVLLTLCAVLLLAPSLLDPIVERLNTLIVQKTQSDSYVERSMWTAVSWQALRDTFGLGVGVGSTRASNFVVAMLSSTGVLGGLLYFGFVLQTYLRRPPADAPPQSGTMLSAVRWSYLPYLCAGVLAGTTADLGTPAAFLYGMSFAVAYRPREEKQKAAPVRLTQRPRSRPGSQHVEELA